MCNLTINNITTIINTGIFNHGEHGGGTLTLLIISTRLITLMNISTINAATVNNPASPVKATPMPLFIFDANIANTIDISG